MSMTHPLSGDNSILDNRGISVQGDGFRYFEQMKSALSSKEISAFQNVCSVRCPQRRFVSLAPRRMR